MNLVFPLVPEELAPLLALSKHPKLFKIWQKKTHHHNHSPQSPNYGFMEQWKHYLVIITRRFLNALPCPFQQYYSAW